MTNSYATANWIFTRAFGFIYLIAFTSLAREARGLFGARGVLPIRDFMTAVASSTGAERYHQIPSLFWFGTTDRFILGLTVAGALAATLVVAGVATGWMLLVCLVIYLSFVTSGQEFMSFQWDILLIEVGVLALFAAPWSFGWTLFEVAEPHALVRAAFAALLFKLMFLSGVVKILSGDPAWRDFTALSYHYWTQPLPNPLSLFAHALPMWAHKIGTAGTFAAELGAPFLLLHPRTQPLAALAFVGLSLFIAVTGNYTFFNVLTVVLCVWLVPDVWWFDFADRLGVRVVPASTNHAITVLMSVLLITNAYWCTRYWLPGTIDRWLQPVASTLRSFYVSNSYGLFATMTKTRPEIVIEGSRDGTAWREYEFKFKPGPLDRRPPQIAPLQPRLDWQMWFAALGSFGGNPFVANLLGRLFEGAPEVRAFFANDPFPDEPPRFLRARLYEYEFTRIEEWWRTGAWWTRRLTGEYSPTYQRIE